MRYPSLPRTRLNKVTSPKRYGALLLAMDAEAISILNFLANGSGELQASMMTDRPHALFITRRSRDTLKTNLAPVVRALVKANWLRFAAGPDGKFGHFWLTEQACAVLRVKD